MAETCFQCGGAGRVISVSPARAVSEIPCPQCQSAAGAQASTPHAAQRPKPARVAVTLLVWAVVIAIVIAALVLVAFPAMFGRAFGSGM